MTNADVVAAIKRHPVGFGCGVISVILAVVIYFVNGKLGEVNESLGQTTLEGTRLAENIKNAAQLPEHFAIVSDANQRIEERLIRASELATNLQYFYRLEAETGAELIDLRQHPLAPPAKGAPKTVYTRVGFAVSLRGDYPTLMNCLQRLESGRHFCRVTAANIESVTMDRAGPLKLSLSLELLGKP